MLIRVTSTAVRMELMTAAAMLTRATAPSTTTARPNPVEAAPPPEDADPGLHMVVPFALGGRRLPVVLPSVAGKDREEAAADDPRQPEPARRAPGRRHAVRRGRRVPPAAGGHDRAAGGLVAGRPSRSGGRGGARARPPHAPRRSGRRHRLTPPGHSGGRRPRPVGPGGAHGAADDRL